MTDVEELKIGQVNVCFDLKCAVIDNFIAGYKSFDVLMYVRCRFIRYVLFTYLYIILLSLHIKLMMA